MDQKKQDAAREAQETSSGEGHALPYDAVGEDANAGEPLCGGAPNEAPAAVKAGGGSGKKKTRLPVIWLIALIVCIAVFLFCAYQLASILLSYGQASGEYNELRLARIPAATPSLAPGQSADPNVPEPLSLPDWASLTAINSHIAGWIYLPGTQIDYPIAYSTDNEYYLTHTFKNTYNTGGCIYVDSSCKTDFTSKNTTLHGHNMKNGAMFHDILQYQKPEFYEAHPYFYLFTPADTYRVEVFSSYVTDAYDTYTAPEFTEKLFDSFLKKRIGMSFSHIRQDVSTLDRIITLSTCTYEYDDARYVVHGRLQRIDPVTREPK